ncbi:YdbH domain-containing protein [Flavisphingomonas formosensis]|uniref:YdbH domain-containing protein n=1 Tax=Flavisphingomonas formosensis TaxID=861534 RepID=UPI0012F7CEB9|nr:YdbH domain-containing protein [Sphingomonas formosensis]
MAEGDRKPPRRWLVGTAGLLVLLAGAVLILWTQRKPIARDLIDETLRAKGVPARYDLVTIEPGLQRIEHLVIGDPRRPDLTADWVELSVGYTPWGGVGVSSLAAGGVRMRGRVRGGRLSLGAIDRLLPASSGGPLSLPDIDMRLSDARMHLDTPFGQAGLALDGSGNLSDGFQGKLAAIAPRLAIGACEADRATAFVNIAVSDSKPAFDGPVRVRGVHCDSGLSLTAPQIAIDATLGEALNSWKGGAHVELLAAGQGTNRLEMLIAQIGFEGDVNETRGDFSTTAQRFSAGRSLAGIAAALDGSYAYRSGEKRFGVKARARVRQAAAEPAALDAALASLGGMAGTPLAPFGVALADAMRRASGTTKLDADIALAGTPARGGFRVSRLVAEGGGAEISWGGGTGVTYVWPAGLTRLDGRLTVDGGGLPQADIRLKQQRPGAPIEGLATIAPYQAGDARIALQPVRFVAAGGRTRFETHATLDGPLGNGRVEGLSMPLSGSFSGDGSFALAAGCMPVDFVRLAIAGMTVGRSRLPLCPLEGPSLLARSPGGTLRGGVRIDRPRLVGTIGKSPLALSANGFSASLSRPGFTAGGVAIRLGTGQAVTRLDVAALRGDYGNAGLGGDFSGLAGKLANVPLLMSDGEGRWRLGGAVLDIGGKLKVADEQTDPRFFPLYTDDVKLTLKDGVITVGGRLREPRRHSGVTDVAIVHDLGSGSGHATLDVPGLTFSDALQPDMLTRLTLGVIANVKGTIRGRGQIRWSPDGVSSDGRFRTDDMSLAAAFGPASGIKGEVVFDDLLALSTPPGQKVTLGEVNPGVAVNDGVIRYQLLPGQKVRVEGGRWPFAGGELVLDDSVLDMSQPVDRRLVFHVKGVKADDFLQRFDFDNINATGTFDGVLPIVFGANGGRIEKGYLEVRESGGSLAYVGELTQRDLGSWGNYAFQSLRSVTYKTLNLQLNGNLDGDMVTQVAFTGLSQGVGAKQNFLTRKIAALPIRFNVTIRAPFRQLLFSARSLYDPSLLVQQNLPTLMKVQEGAAKPAPVQPPVSGNKP